MLISRRAMIIFVAITFLLYFNGYNNAAASPVTISDVNVTVANWLQETENHFGEILGANIDQIKLYRGGIHGNVGYFLVTLSPNGWVILPTDDDFWPIQTFGPGVMSEEAYENTLWYKIVCFNSDAVVVRNGSTVQNIILSTREKITEISKNKARWKTLKDTAPKESVQPVHRSISTAGLTAAADIRVAPLMGRERYWGQGYPFNVLNRHSEITKYSTSNDEFAGTNVSEREYLVGCPALATGQVMYNILTRKYPPTVGNNLVLDANSTSTRFGVVRKYSDIMDAPDEGKYFYFPESNLTKAYDWQNMSNFLLTQPTNLFDQLYQVTLQSSDITTANTKIAPLLRDLGLLLPEYTFRNSSILSANTPYNAMRSDGNLASNVFSRYGFLSAHNFVIYKMQGEMRVPDTMLPNARKHLVNTNLDFGFPVVAGFTMINSNGIVDGHASPVDGYAYDTWQNESKIDYNEPYYHVVTGGGA